MVNFLKEIALANPSGFTFDISNMKPIEGGYIASYAATQSSHDEKGLLFCLFHALMHDFVIGGWLDGELFYFDSCKVFDSLDDAIEFGRQQNQIAVFDLNEMREIRL